MRRLISMIIYLFIGFCLHAQDSLTCGFERLFTIKSGMDKAEVMDLMNKNYPSNLVKTEMVKLPPYNGSGGDSIVKETLTFKRDITPCFKGLNTLLKFEFGDNKLYKAYIMTEFPKTAYQDMMSNYNFLRNVIKAKWAYEAATKMADGTVVGFGYDYTKTKKPTNKTEKISLQYVDRATDNNKINYLLEVFWANLQNTRMEVSNY